MLKFRNITYKRSDQWQLPQCSAHIKPGAFWWIKGENGAGKSTLLKLLYGLFKPDSGKIERQEGIRFSYVGHEPFFKPYRPVYTQLTDWIKLLNLNSSHSILQDTLDLCLESWNCTPYKNSLYGSLSMGQKKRVDLCLLTYAHHPSIQTPALWLVDEPLSCLDQESQILFWHHANHHLMGGGSIIFTSHLTQQPEVPTFYILNL